MHRTSIRFDRELREYAMYLDGEIVGYARTETEAAITLAELVMSITEHAARLTPVATTEEV